MSTCGRIVLLLGLAVVNPAAGAEKAQPWLEVRSPHFVVVSNGGEKQARRIAEQFELMRGVFKKLYPWMRVDPGVPPVIIAAKDERTLGELLPAFRERKGGVRPQGVFVRREDKNYVALRLDVQGPKPYHLVYHEYVHMLISLNFSWLPLWLNEGLAELFATAEIGTKEVIIGPPSRLQLRVLRENPLLPLDVLFSVDHSSPQYSEENKASIFYAQSWAVMHYFMLGDSMTHVKPLNDYLTLISNDVEEPAARKRALGDLKELEQKLRVYIGLFSFPAFRMEAPEQIGEELLPARELSGAESAAVRGDFLVHTQHLSEARALLEEALRKDPMLAAAHESMGFMHFQQGNREEAAKWFKQAVELDSRSCLAHYYSALFLSQQAEREEVAEEVEAALRRAIELNPNFAPAYSVLGGHYAAHEERLDEAVRLVHKAVELEPGIVAFQVNYGQVLLTANRVGEAKRIGERALAAAKSAEDRSQVQSLLENVRRYEECLATRKRVEEAERKAKEEWERSLAEVRRAREESRDAGAPGPVTAGGEVQPTQGIGEGQVIEVSCTPRGAMKLALALPTFKLELRARNYHRVEFLTSDWEAPPPFNPCQHLKGRTARVTYKIGGTEAGEMVSVEVRK